MRFAALGRTSILVDAIRACAASGHMPVLIATAQPSPEYTVGAKAFEDVANEFACQYLFGNRLDSHAELIKASEPQVAISMNWPTLVAPSVLNMFPCGIINAHGGDLPRFRGNACPNWAIVAGEPSIAVTVHQMVAELDSGPVLAKRQLPLRSDTYIGEVYAFLRREVPSMFVQVLNDLEKNVAISVDQSPNAEESLRCFPRMPRDSEIDWSKGAEELAAVVRAGAEPFGGSYTYWSTRKLIIWRARAEQLPYPWLGVPGQVAEIRHQAGEVVVLCGTGVLVLQEVQESGSDRRAASDIVRSTRVRFGTDVSGELADLRFRVAALEERLRRGTET